MRIVSLQIATTGSIKHISIVCGRIAIIDSATRQGKLILIIYSSCRDQYMYLYMYLYICICIYICTLISVSASVSVSIYVPLYLYLYLYLYMYLYICICICICMYLHMYLYLRDYICIWNRFLIKSRQNVKFKFIQITSTI